MSFIDVSRPVNLRATWPHQQNNSCRTQLSHTTDRGESVLMIGVPVRSGQQIRGIVQVIQRPVAAKAAERGCVHFLEQVASLVADSLAFRL